MASFASDYINNAKNRKIVATTTPIESIQNIQTSTPKVGGYDLNQEKFDFLSHSILEGIGNNNFGTVSDYDTYRNMTTSQKLKETANAIGRFTGNLITSIPTAIVSAPFSIYETAKQTVKNIVSPGKEGLLTAEEKPNSYFRLGEIPSWYKTREEYKKAGYGELGANFLTGLKAFGDVTVSIDAINSVKSAFTPRKILGKGEKIGNVQPIVNIISKETENIPKTIKKIDSSNEYYSLPKTEAKKYGGTSENVFVKLTPSQEGKIEVSIVKLDKVNKNELGNSDFPGKKETKVFSDIVEVQKNNLIDDVTPINKTDETQVPKQNGTMIYYTKKPTPGMENKPISPKEISTMNTLAKVQGFDSDIVPSLSKIFTGKSNIGELTHGEYIKVMNQIGTMPKISEFAPNSPFAIDLKTSASRYLSPRLKFASAEETRTGIPIASKVTIPVEEAFSMVKKQKIIYDKIKTDIFGKYESAAKYANERKLIDQYTRGNKEAITKSNLPDNVKQELINVSEKLNSFYKRVHETQEFGKPIEQYRENYAPAVQDIGGRIPRFKSEIKGLAPGISDPFFTFERHGTTLPILDDASALFDIYVVDGLKGKYVKPVFENINKDTQLINASKYQKDWIKSYLGDKVGYGTEFDKSLYKLSGDLNKKFGWNLPPDAVKNVSEDLMQTMYSSALGLPRISPVLRDTITTDAIRHGRLGSRFEGDAIIASFKKGSTDYARSRGWLVEDIAKEYGQEIAAKADVSSNIAKARELYNNMTRKSLSFYGKGDNRMRIKVGYQAQMLFDDAISRYNKGEITWQDVEKTPIFSGMDKPSLDYVRQNIIKGDLDKARNFVERKTIDDINFPFRSGTGAPFTSGTEGKLIGGLTSWNNNFLHTLGYWVKTKQFNNFTRMLSRFEIYRRSLMDAFNIDTSNFTDLRSTASITASPALQFAYSGLSLISNWLKQNRTEVNKNSDEIFRSIQALGGLPGAIPSSIISGEFKGGGVGLMNLQDFYKSYKSFGQPGVPEGKFRVYNQNGATKEFADFTDIFIRAMGFDTKQEGKIKRQTTLMANTETKRDEISKDITNKFLEAWNIENTNERNKALQVVSQMMKDNNIKKDFTEVIKNYSTPAILLRYERLPNDLKQIFYSSIKDIREQMLK